MKQIIRVTSYDIAKAVVAVFHASGAKFKAIGTGNDGTSDYVWIDWA